MQFLPKDPRDWLPDLAAALRAIACALNGEEPTPQRMKAVASTFVGAVPEHQLEMHWLEHGYMYDPDIDDPREPEWAITISGHRLKIGWLIPAADLPQVLALSSGKGTPDER